MPGAIVARLNKCSLKVNVTRRLFLASLPWLVFGCAREVDEEVSGHQRYTGTAPWTIGGARPGMMLAELKQHRGEPRGSFGVPPRGFIWGSSGELGEISVEMDADDRIRRVQGTDLSAGPLTLLGRGASNADVTAVLGKGVSKSMTQPGSFVAPTPGKQIGMQHYYRNGVAEFRIVVMKNTGLTGIVAEAK